MLKFDRVTALALAAGSVPLVIVVSTLAVGPDRQHLWSVVRDFLTTNAVAVAAVVQAITAIVMVALTRRLARPRGMLCRQPTIKSRSQR